jgi:hypothetical protein
MIGEAVIATLEDANAQQRDSQVYQAALAQSIADPSVLRETSLVLAHPAWPAG